MLILTRDINTSFMIGKDVKVTLLGVRGKQARIGIEAPSDIDIVREELVEQWDPQWRVTND